MEKINPSSHFAFPTSSFYLIPVNIAPWRAFNPQQITCAVAYRHSLLKTLATYICGPIVCAAFNDKETKTSKGLILWNTKPFGQGPLSRKWGPEHLTEWNWVNVPLKKEKKRENTDLNGICKWLPNRRDYWTLPTACRVFGRSSFFWKYVKNIGSETASSAVGDKIPTKSTDRMDLDVMEITPTIFSLYFNRFRSLKEVTSFPSSLSQESLVYCQLLLVCTMHIAAGMQPSSSLLPMCFW